MREPKSSDFFPSPWLMLVSAAVTLFGAISILAAGKLAPGLFLVALGVGFVVMAWFRAKTAQPMGKGWWWHRAPAGQRLALAIVGLLLEAALGLWMIVDSDSVFSTSLGWIAVIAAPFLIPFFVFQARRAWKERV